jgi:hypothetical protein
MLYYFYVKNWLGAKLRREEGIETIEWIALAAVILVFLFAMLGLMTNFGRAVAAAIWMQIMKWIGRW